MKVELITLDLCKKFVDAYNDWYHEYLNETINPALTESVDYILNVLKDTNLNAHDVKDLQKLYSMWIGYDMECAEHNMPHVDIAFYMYAHRYFVNRIGL